MEKGRCYAIQCDAIRCDSMRCDASIEPGIESRGRDPLGKYGRKAGEARALATFRANVALADAPLALIAR